MGRKKSEGRKKSREIRSWDEEVSKKGIRIERSGITKSTEGLRKEI